MPWKLIQKLSDDKGEFRAESGKTAVLWLPDNSQGKRPYTFAKRPEFAAPEFTPERGRALQKHRTELARNAVRDALMSHPDSVSDADGLKMIAEAQVVLASDPDKGSAATGAANWVWAKGGYDEAPQHQDRPALKLEISKDGLEGLIDRAKAVDAEYRVLVDPDEESDVQ